jgi:ribosomal protein S18 acetylase RimI-like enzyme
MPPIAPLPNLSLLTRDQIEAELDDLAQLLHACVADGASINFILPYSLDDARTFWRRKVLARLAEDAPLFVMVARLDGRIVGSVQLDCDTPPNQAHRADIKKLLVHPHVQRRGVGRRLMEDIEALAVGKGISLLTLDTRSGDKGETLYLSRGFEIAGIIPCYSRDARENRLDAATFMYKTLAA